MKNTLQILGIALSTLFLGNLANAQTVEFREYKEETKISGWSNYDGPGTVIKEFPPIVKNITPGFSQYDNTYIIVTYDKAINDEIYNTLVKTKEVPYPYDKQGLVGKAVAKKKGVYDLKYKEGKTKDELFSYKVTVNEKVIYDDATTKDRTKLDGFFSFHCYSFDHLENYFSTKYGYVGAINPYRLFYGSSKSEVQNALKLGNNEVKVAVSYNGKSLGESSMIYTLNEFKLADDNFCGNPKYLRENDKETYDICKKKFNNKFLDEIEEKNYKLVALYLKNESWVEFKEMSSGYPAERIKNFTIYLSDANNNVYEANMHIRQDYLGAGAYGDTYLNNTSRSIEEFPPIKKECFDLIKAKYGTLK